MKLPKYRYYLYAMIFSAANTSMAGFFTKEPPADFLVLEACGGYSTYSCTLKEFSEKAFIKSFSRSWDDDGSGGWILLLKGNDKASGKDIRVTLTFEEVENEKGKFANPTRINSSGQDIPSGMIPNFYIPMAEKAGQATGRKWKAHSNTRKKDPKVVEAERQTKAQMDELDAIQVRDTKVMEAQEAKRNKEIEESQRKRAAAEKKQDSDIFSSIPGRYLNRNGMPGETIISGTGNPLTLAFIKPECSFSGKPVSVTFDSYRSLSVGKLVEGACKVTYLFQRVKIGDQDDDSVQVDAVDGNCSSLCKNADMNLLGDYRKKHGG